MSGRIKVFMQRLSVCLLQTSLSFPKPPTGALSVPVVNCSSFFLSSSVISWTTDQKSLIVVEFLWNPSYSVNSSITLKSYSFHAIENIGR